MAGKAGFQAVTGPLAVLTPAEMGRADALAPEFGVPTLSLMEAAGRAVADAAYRMAGGAPVHILCGPGNNGGDGFVAARILARQGVRVSLASTGRRDSYTGDAAQMAQLWQGSVAPASGTALPQDAIVIDALFGAGLRRDLEGDIAALVDTVNASGRPVLAVDLPSGVDGDAGQVRGTAIRALRTVTFWRLKPGHLLCPGRALCGVTEVARIGMPEAVLGVVDPKTFLNQPELWRGAWPALSDGGNKFTRGHVLVVSGGLTATGAPRLAARAALRAGAGLVTVASPADALAVHATALEAVMVRRSEGATDLAGLLEDRRRNCVVIGPGLEPDEETRRMVEVALGSGRAVVLDAGGLSAFADDKDRLQAALRAATGPVVLTPHEGEFGRAFAIPADLAKTQRARLASQAGNVVVLLKGPDTVIAAPDGRAAINANAPPTLATAGSGDVLAGLIGGLMAQGVPAFEAACSGTWLHGAAASGFGPGLIASDLPDLMPAVLAQLADGATAPRTS